MVTRIWWDYIIPDHWEDIRSCVNSRSVRQSQWDQNIRKMECVIGLIMRWDEMRKYWMRYKVRRKLSIPGFNKFIHPVSGSLSTMPVSLYTPVAHSLSIIPVSLYPYQSLILWQVDGRWWSETDCPSTTPPWPVGESTPLPFRITVYPKTRNNIRVT